MIRSVDQPQYFWYIPPDVSWQPIIISELSALYSKWLHHLELKVNKIMKYSICGWELEVVKYSATLQELTLDCTEASGKVDLSTCEHVFFFESHIQYIQIMKYFIVTFIGRYLARFRSTYTCRQTLIGNVFDEDCMDSLYTDIYKVYHCESDRFDHSSQTFFLFGGKSVS